MAEGIHSERLAFAQGSVEARAFALLHAHAGGEAGCALCLLAWLARVLGTPGPSKQAVAYEACALVGQLGAVTSICFEALIWPNDPRCRARLDALEGALGAGGLAALPMPPYEALS